MGIGLEGIAAIGAIVIAVLGFVWRIAVITTRICRNEDAIKAAHTRLDKYVSKHESSIEEMKSQINAIVQTQIRIEEKLSFLIDDRK
jgi:hypothetical protein